MVRKAALLVMTEGGIVRKLENYGESQLAYKMRKNHEWFNMGNQWSMLFDCSPSCVSKISQTLNLDPSVIRHGIIKMGKSTVQL